MMNLTNSMMSERSQNQKNNNILFHLYDIEEQAKIICDDRIQKVVTHELGDSGWKWHEGGFWMAYFLFFDSGPGYTGVSNL